MPITIALVTILKPNHFSKWPKSEPDLMRSRGPYLSVSYKQGNKQDEVARATGVSQQAISALSKKFRATRVVKDSPRPGCPRVMTEREDRIIIAIARENLFFSGNNLNSI